MENSRRVQKWEDSSAIGLRGIELVKEFLRESTSRIQQNSARPRLWYETLLIDDVQDRKAYRTLGIDLLCFVRSSSGVCCMPIEVKADTYFHTGNFFMETVSDTLRNTPGAFLHCKAEWYFYCFIDIPILYCMPMPEVKPWFQSRIESFPERTAHSDRNGSGWSTKGRLVPISTMLSEMRGIEVFEKKNGTWLRVENSVA